MKVIELTTQQRIIILEDVLIKLESGDTGGGLCMKIEDSAFELLRVRDYAENIVPIFTLKNARKVTDVVDDAVIGGYWWHTTFCYDFENRIKFVKWMIEQEKLTINI